MNIESILNQAILFGYWLIAIFALIGALLAYYCFARAEGTKPKDGTASET